MRHFSKRKKRGQVENFGTMSPRKNVSSSESEITEELSSGEETFPRKQSEIKEKKNSGGFFSFRGFASRFTGGVQKKDKSTKKKETKI